MQIRPVGAEMFHADRQRDITKLIVDFLTFASAPKKKESLLNWKFNWLSCGKIYAVRSSSKVS